MGAPPNAGNIELWGRHEGTGATDAGSGDGPRFDARAGLAAAQARRGDGRRGTAVRTRWESERVPMCEEGGWERRLSVRAGGVRCGDAGGHARRVRA